METVLHNCKENMLDYLILDIETVEYTIERYMELEILDYLLDKNIRRTFHPLFSQLILIGVKCSDGSEEIFIIDPKKNIETEERRILTQFWKYIEQKSPAKIVTYNGRFDINYINVKSIVHDVLPTMLIDTSYRKLSDTNHYDCMNILAQQIGTGSSDVQWVSLPVACKTLGFKIPEGYTPSEKVSEFFYAGNLNEIVRHNKIDLQMTEMVFKKLSPYIEKIVTLEKNNALLHDIEKVRNAVENKNLTIEDIINNMDMFSKSSISPLIDIFKSEAPREPPTESQKDFLARLLRESKSGLDPLLNVTTLRDETIKDLIKIIEIIKKKKHPMQ